MITQDPHPLLYLQAFRCQFPNPIGEYSEEALKPIRAFFTTDKHSPLQTIETKTIIRNLLRYGGFSPSGRNKPAHEYLNKAIEKGWFTPNKGINAAVDACNVASLHSALPISVVDTSKITPPLHIRCCPKDTSYPFNPSGQILKADGLLSMWDTLGPSASPVKDSQRSKTSEQTVSTISIIWSHIELQQHADATALWYQNLLSTLGATIEVMPIQVQNAS